MFALMLSLPWEYGYEVNAKQSGKFTLFSSFGEGILSMMVGYLMSLIDLNFLFYTILACSIILKFCFDQILKEFDNSEVKKSHEI
jgi:hypothetical protein